MPLQKVYAKQKGYVHWPSVITDFHPVKARVAKAEFFGWNHQWAWISFDNLLLPEAAEHVIEKNMHNVKFAKAYNEMNIWKPMIEISSLCSLISETCNTSTQSKSRLSEKSGSAIKQIQFSPRN